MTPGEKYRIMLLYSFSYYEILIACDKDSQSMIQVERRVAQIYDLVRTPRAHAFSMLLEETTEFQNIGPGISKISCNLNQIVGIHLTTTISLNPNKELSNLWQPLSFV